MVTQYAVPVQPGLGYLLEQEKMALQKYIAEIDAKSRSAAAAASAGAQKYVANVNAKLERDLSAGRIDADKYMQERDLAQREAEFVRDLAFKELAEQNATELGWAQQRLAEIETGARLAANPADFVQSEYFKRGMQMPENAAVLSGQGGAETNGFASAGVNTPEQLGGIEYVAPPAYSDETLQGVAGGIFKGGAKPLYNPNLGGTGAFGADVASPNEMSRAQFGTLDDSQMGILSSFLKAGVDQPVAGGGTRKVAINPADWFKQVQNSWVPTLQAAGPTQYQN